jgi:retinol dehydrogenase-14
MGFSGSNDLNRGAATSVFLAASDQVEGISGKYWNKKEQENPNSIALDHNIQERLWTYSEKLIKKLTN